MRHVLAELGERDLAGAEAELTLPSIGITLPLSPIYQDVLSETA